MSKEMEIIEESFQKIYTSLKNGSFTMDELSFVKKFAEAVIVTASNSIMKSYKGVYFYDLQKR